jgi:hypothetical protein
LNHYPRAVASQSATIDESSLTVAAISVPDDMSRNSLELGMSGRATAFSPKVGVIGLLASIPVWINSYAAYLQRISFGLDQERFDRLRERDFAMRQNGARQFCRFRIGATAGQRYRFPAMSRAFGGEHVVAFRIWSCFGVRFG